MCLLLRFVTIMIFSLYLVNADCPPIVSRREWNAINPVHVQYLTRPVGTVIITHTAGATCEPDNPDLSCEVVVQRLQDYYLEKLGSWDIGATFYIGNNAKIYEGVGWLHVGFHTPGFNDNTVAISFFGNYNNISPTYDQLEAAKALIRCGVQEGHISQGYHVVVQRQLYATQSPGRKLYNAIRRWPDWLEDARPLKNSTLSNNV